MINENSWPGFLTVRIFLQFDQPTLLLDGRDVYLQGDSEVLLDAYRKYATDVTTALGANPMSASEQMKDMVDFEIELARVIW